MNEYEKTTTEGAMKGRDKMGKNVYWFEDCCLLGCSTV
jgi:hypothetical protein